MVGGVLNRRGGRVKMEGRWQMGKGEIKADQEREREERVSGVWR